MKPYEFKRSYHPKMGKFMFKQGIRYNCWQYIQTPKTCSFDSAQKFYRTIRKKAMKSGAEYAGDKIDRKAEEKSGDL